MLVARGTTPSAKFARTRSPPDSWNIPPWDILDSACPQTKHYKNGSFSSPSHLIAGTKYYLIQSSGRCFL
jgi:hypothetical protein